MPVVDAPREELLKELDRLEADVAARTRHLPPLSDEEAEAIADELVREAVESLVLHGKIVFERNQRSAAGPAGLVRPIIEGECTVVGSILGATIGRGR